MKVQSLGFSLVLAAMFLGACSTSPSSTSVDEAASTTLIDNTTELVITVEAGSDLLDLPLWEDFVVRLKPRPTPSTGATEYVDVGDLGADGTLSISLPETTSDIYVTNGVWDCQWYGIGEVEPGQTAVHVTVSDYDCVEDN